MVDQPTSPTQGLGLKTMSLTYNGKKVIRNSTSGHSPNKTSSQTPLAKKSQCETDVTTSILRNLLGTKLLDSSSQDQTITISFKLLTKLLSQGAKESVVVVSENLKGVKYGRPPKGSTSTNPKKVVHMTKKHEETMKRGVTTRSK
jgi:hypothetical protein